MAWTGNYTCTSFKKELLTALHNFSAAGGDTFKLALYDSNATLNAETTAYSATDEVSGTGYTAGGITLTNVEPTSGGTRGYTDFADATFSTVTLSDIRGGLVYNSTNGNRAVIVLDFGISKSKTAADFDVTFPTADEINAIILVK
jgi:hypothetical protein